MTVWLLIGQVLAASPGSGQGIALGLFANRADYDYSGLIAEIEATGATDVLIAVPWSIPTVSSSALRSAVPRGVLAGVLRAATDAELTVCVMPIITVDQRRAGEWRGVLAPSDPSIFWSNYQGLIRDVAVDAERAGATRLVVGSELNSLEADPVWPDLVDGVRDVFTGSVVYSANWDRFDQVPFWPLVDEVGITAYFPIEGPQTWPAELARLQAFAQTQDRPLVVTEYGYPALSTASERPWDETTGAAYDGHLQASLIDDALRALSADPPQAHFLWNWFGTGAVTESSFSPRHRPASNVVHRRFHSPQPSSDTP